MLEGVVADIGREMDNLKDKYRWELILVNDCSPDNTFEVIRRLCEKHKNICGVNLARNFGQHAALMAGFHQVKGDYLVCMDCLLYTSIQGWLSVPWRCFPIIS